MKEQVKKLIESVETCTIGAGIYGGEIYVRKSDFDRVVEELTKPNVLNRCPICGGNGIVPNGFYTLTTEIWSTVSTTPEKCKSCNGTGIVWN